MKYWDILKYGEQEIIRMNLFLQQLLGVHILTPIEYNEKREIDKKYEEFNKIKMLNIRDYALLDLYKR